MRTCQQMICRQTALSTIILQAILSAGLSFAPPHDLHRYVSSNHSAVANGGARFQEVLLSPLALLSSLETAVAWQPAQENETQVILASQKLLTPPLDQRYVIVFVVGYTAAWSAVILSLILIRRHYLRGTELTGTLTPHIRSMLFIRLLLGVVLFAVISIIALVLPELTPFWRFLGTLVLANTFQKMREMILSVVGGSVHLLLLIRDSVPDVPDSPPNLYSNVPCCFTRYCIPARQPEQVDVRYLKLGVSQLIVIQPLIAMICCVGDVEIEMGSRYWSPRIQVFIVITSLKITSTLICMAACGGLIQLVEMFNKQAADQIDLKHKMKFAQSFGWGLNIFPLLAALMPVFSDNPQLKNGMFLRATTCHDLVESVIISCGALLTALVAWRYLPADDAHYPELDSNSASQEEQLQRLQFCPFCGGDSLVLEDTVLNGVEAAACSDCGRAGIPMRLEIRKPKKTADQQKNIT